MLYNKVLMSSSNRLSTHNQNWTVLVRVIAEIKTFGYLSERRTRGDPSLIFEAAQLDLNLDTFLYHRLSPLMAWLHDFSTAL